ncbi:hypothetical protein E4U41_004531 [Claviceps citrina]|nr:hypothetical protein E4U41_004531 [Claviceps citrina]
MPPSEASPSPAPKKRKDAPPDAQNPSKRRKAQPSPRMSLIGPHEALISQLRPAHNMLAASVISSTKIRKRVAQITSHLCGSGSGGGGGGGESGLPPVAVLYARTAEVCKMITITEQCKRLMREQGRSWFQYNQTFDLPAGDRGDPGDRDVVEETVLGGGEQGGESSDDGFEVMASRFEKAIAPAPRERVVRSMRVLLSVQTIGELRGRNGVTVQSSEDGS